MGLFGKRKRRKDIGAEEVITPQTATPLKTAASDAVATLSPKEAEVFDMLLQGYKLREIAAMTGCTFSTINTHQNSIYSKLGVSSRAELIIKYKS